MATSKAKSAKKATSKLKTVDTVEAKTTKKENKTITSTPSKKSCVKTFFSRKFDASENILTIFGNKKIIAALIGEALGTAFITTIVLTLGLNNPLYTILGYVGITAAVFALSGANLNPAITAGMLATRRYSAIRGTLYIIAQILGAWLGFLVINAFFRAGITAGNIDPSTASLPTLTSASDLSANTEGYSYFWPITMIEFTGAAIIAFFYARALSCKRSTFTFASIVAGGVFLASVIAVLVSGNYLGLGYDANGAQVNIFVMNPAVALMYGVFPTSADGLGELFSALCPMLVSYVVFPVLGAIAGFYLSDVASVCAEEKLD